ncbi:major facilitator superfamily transporter [Biscogniauxia marginata]|nr:major facilitator superfamily transporter [Biscogniauxia marginata]
MAERSLAPKWPFQMEVDAELWSRGAPLGRTFEELSKEEIMALREIYALELAKRMEASAEPAVEQVEKRVEEQARDDPQVMGSTNFYENGKIRLIPPTNFVPDPLNLPNWRKWFAIGVLCFFGALSLAAEVAVASQLPVFLLEYSGLDPAEVLSNTDFQEKLSGKEGLDPLDVIPEGVQPASLAQVALLATIPLLSNGIASYFLVPMSIAVGRRPILLLTATFSWAGGLWAGFSQSLESHLAARVIHGLGAGAVEALLPLIAQDIVFIHQRNRALSAIIASQGPIIIATGVAGPYLAANITWRWIYWFTSILGIVAWILIILFVPETRWNRSKEELAGQKLWPVAEGADRTELDYVTYGPRTMKTDLALFPETFEWKKAGQSIVNCAKSTMFPAVFWAILINSAFSTVQSSTSQTISFALLAAGIPYEYTGLGVIPSVLASGIAYVLGGPIADRISLYMTRSLGKGRREPEYGLMNLVVPVLLGVAGALVFGHAAQDKAHFGIMLLGNTFLLAGALTTASVVNSFVIESYPQMPGPVLVNVSSLRIIISFGTASQATVWVQQVGPAGLFGAYSVMLVIVALGIPALFFYGKKMRKLTAGSVGKAVEKDGDEKA